MTDPLNAVYEKYKHLDVCLGDPGWGQSGDSAAIYGIAGELWRAVKEAREKPRPPCEECIYQAQSAQAPSLQAINEIIEDLSSRSCLGRCWEKIDFETACGIREVWRVIISRHMGALSTRIKAERENPLTENGCTDTENCDEICQHSRVYSPVQMQQAIAQATAAENKRVLDNTLRFVCVYESFLTCDDKNNEIYGVRSESVKNHLESLRLAQPEPTEREPE